jgi:DNA-3-methyladenine glycosylase II
MTGRVSRVSTLDGDGLRRGVRVLARRDADLAAAVRRTGPPPLWARRPGFATLARIILEQQVSLGSARAVYGRLEAALGGVTPVTVGACGVAGLRRLGVTRQKASYLHGAAVLIATGELDLPRVGRLPDEEARARLMQVRGIGPWTADIYLLMALRRPDVWPTGDIALLTALQALRGLRRRPTVERAAACARRWRPWRAVAARILWSGYLAGDLVREGRRARDA